MNVHTNQNISSSCFPPGTQQATLCVCIQVVCQGHRQMFFPRSSSADWRQYCPCFPRQKSLPPWLCWLGALWMLPTTGKATSPVFTVKLKSLADFTRWDMVHRPPQLAKLHEQEQRGNGRLLGWYHLQLVQLFARLRSACDFQTWPQNNQLSGTSLQGTYQSNYLFLSESTDVTWHSCTVSVLPCCQITHCFSLLCP